MLEEGSVLLVIGVGREVGKTQQVDRENRIAGSMRIS